jgi:hypothetical protein
MRLKYLLPILTLVLAAPLWAGAPVQTVKDIDQYRAGLEKHLSAGKFSIRMFVKPVGKPGGWKEILRDKDLDRLCKNGCTDSLSAYRRGGHILVVSLESGDPKGDWSRYVESYFREDGTLALSRLDFRVHQTGSDGKPTLVQSVRYRYYSPEGKILKQTHPEYRDLRMKKTLPKEDLPETEWIVYAHSSDLPVAKLLK